MTTRSGGLLHHYAALNREGQAIRAARKQGLTDARHRRIAYHQNNQARGPRNAD
jgi:hypothetical protein